MKELSKDWAAGHDWYLGCDRKPDGSYTVTVDATGEDNYTLFYDGADGEPNAMLIRPHNNQLVFDSYLALRAWAGY